MTPQARAQAAIDLLDEIVASARAGGAAADTLIARYFASRRYAGSKDRRAVRELVYRSIRRAGECPVSGRAALLGLAEEDAEVRALFDGSTHAPAVITEDEVGASEGVAPQWLVDKLSASLLPENMPALLGRATLDVRVNSLKGDRQSLLDRIDAQPTFHAPTGLRLPEGTQIEGLPEWRDGLIEVQDEGSQLVGTAAKAEPGMAVIDLCAGAGGKTLSLAAAMGNRGHILACDIDRARLSRLAPRAERAGVTIVETRLLNPNHEADALADFEGKADLVVIDAPCSGTGTWRRNPEARWRLTPARLAQLIDVQSRLLTLGARLVRPGGRLHYIVCSLLPEEGRDQIDRFLKERDGWVEQPIDMLAGRPMGAGHMLDPAHDGTDGFFVATALRSC